MLRVSLTIAFLGCYVQGAKDNTDIAMMDSLKCVTQEDESLICEFHVHPPDAKRKIMLNDCPPDSNVCVQAAISTRRQDDDSNPVTPPDIEPPTTLQRAAATIATPSDVIIVGKATYRPPFSQYGPRVAQHLNQLLPLSSSTTNNIEWASWYLALAFEHFNTIDPQAAVVDWVEMELALNAYRQAVEKIGTPSSPEEELLLASAYFQMGETYLRHPEQTHGKDALTYFTKAKELYSTLRNNNDAPAPSPSSRLMEPEDFDLRWADACTRISILLVASATPIHQATMDLMASAMNSGGVNNDDMIAEREMEELVQEVQNTQAVLQDADALLQGAVAVYRTALLQTSENDVWERLTTQMALGTALQNAAMVANMAGNMEQAMEYNLEALSLHRDDLLPQLDAYSPEGENSRVTTADILLEMADTTLQLGQYDDANLYYRQALEWHDQHNIPVYPIMENANALHDGDTLQQHIDALQDYRSMINGGTLNEKEVTLEGLNNDANNDYYYQRDDGYEGDLHLTLGTLYLSNDDLEKAMTYFENAISLYQTSSDDANSHRMADAKTNLAMAFFRARQFQESIRLHTEALELYQTLYGDGVNPLTQEFEDDYDELLGMPLSQVLKGGGATNGAAGAAAEGGRGGVAGGGIHIDLEKYKQSLKNATEAAANKGADEL